MTGATVLAIDTAAAACSVALWQNGAIAQHKAEIMPRGQDARLIPLIEEVLAAAQIGFTALTRIAAARGPGSFTGLRIGLAAARGLGLGLGIPVLGVDRFRLYRRALPEAQDMLVILDSRRDELFCHRFQPGDSAAPFLATGAQLATYDHPGLIVCGDAAGSIDWRRAARADLPHSEAEIAAAMAAAVGEIGEDWPPLPLYLRAPDVSCGPAPPVEESQEAAS